MVGDVKQSIYRFRHANPDNFMSRKNSYPLLEGLDPQREGPAKVVLGSNFRSRAGVCGYVNFLFGLLMSEEAGEMDYTEEERLLPAAVFPKRDEADVELHLLNCRQEGEKREQAEARYIARYIRGYMDGKPRLRDREAPDRLRPARFGDFTILLRSPSSRAQIYVNELRRQGIPVWADLGGFLQTTEIMTFLSLLQVIDNPRREVALLAVLLSPLFGFTPEEAAQIRIGSRRGGLYPALLRAAKDDPKCAAFLETLRAYRQMAVTLSVEALIRRLYEITGYTALVLALPDGQRRRANLLLLLDYARTFDAEEGGLSGFLRFMDKLGESENLKSAPAAGQGGEAVKIMSIHASKGLQFPVCILAAGSSRFNKADSTDSLLVHEKGGVGFKLYDEAQGMRYTTAAREAIALLTDEAAMAEELRLLYVALTRAEEKLALLVCEDNLERSLARLAGGLQQEGEGVDPATVLSARGYADWMLTAGLLHPDGAALRTLAGLSLSPAPAEGRMAVFLEDDAAVSPKPETGPTSAALSQTAAAQAAAEQITLSQTALSQTAAAQTALSQTDVSQTAVSQTADGQLSFFQEAGDGERAEQTRLAAELDARFDYVYPYEGLNELTAKTGVAKLVEQRADRAFAFTRRPAFLAKSGLTPAERGVAVHAFMQFADYEAAARDPAAELERLADRGFLTVQQADAIDPAVLRRFFDGPLYKRLAAAVCLDREVRFLTELPARRIDPALSERLSGERVVVQGVADCVFEEPDGLVILDFKTDRGKSLEQLLEDYGDQLRVYAEALRDTYQKPVKECVLYAFGQGASISFPPAQNA
ncbi:MAG: UvrD-helicase domain-containing protein, partial [Clostridiales bacterium]|nr:UvrD-helicase domain-containing protein [Clostridiales bacterium]